MVPLVLDLESGGKSAEGFSNHRDDQPVAQTHLQCQVKDAGAAPNTHYCDIPSQDFGSEPDGRLRQSFKQMLLQGLGLLP